MSLAGLLDQIQEWKQRRNAVILAHNYQPGEVQDLADFNGDSLELARKCTQVEAEVIVFCGVHFMAETAAILNPGKTVLLPDAHAGCPMADMADGEGVRALKAQHPEAKVVCYVNSTVEVKAESDICCTSSNAVEVVKTIPAETPVIFVPDRNLGGHVAEKLGRENMILWPGYCPTHQWMTVREFEGARAEHPEAVVMVHPECSKPVRDLADEVLSTGQMCRFARESAAREFIVGTEEGINHRLRKENPGKRFYAVSDRAVCPNMKKISPEKVLWSLESLETRITVEPQIAARALKAIEGMLAVTG